MGFGLVLLGVAGAFLWLCYWMDCQHDALQWKQRRGVK